MRGVIPRTVPLFYDQEKMKKAIFLLTLILFVSIIISKRSDRITPQSPEMRPILNKIIRSNQTLTISLVGDMCFDNLVAERMKMHGDDFVFSGYSEYFKNSDVLFGNLETPLTKVEPEEIVKDYHFKSNPKIAGLLKKNNFSAVSIANNHMLDSGRAGLYETVQTLYKYGVGFAGGEYNIEKAVKPFYVKAKGMKVGFLAFSKVVPSHDWAAGENKYGLACAYSWHEKVYKDAITSAKKDCDILVVSVHWGKERVAEVDDDDVATAHRMIDSGADIIMGHHPHVVAKMEYYKEKPIFYSLGNFIFTTSNYNEANKTIMARILINSQKKIGEVSVIPGKIIESAPIPMDGPEKEMFVKRFMDDEAGKFPVSVVQAKKKPAG